MKTFIIGLVCLMCGDGREIEVADLAMVGRQPRCPRCSGAILATDITAKVQYERPPLTAQDFPHRRLGRPPKPFAGQRRPEIEGATSKGEIRSTSDRVSANSNGQTGSVM